MKISGKSPGYWRLLGVVTLFRRPGCVLLALISSNSWLLARYLAMDMCARYAIERIVFTITVVVSYGLHYGKCFSCTYALTQTPYACEWVGFYGFLIIQANPILETLLVFLL